MSQQQPQQEQEQATSGLEVDNMADCKKYNGSTWEHSLRKLTTATDTITTLPADLYADGTNATVGLQGNMSQSGTPSPATPIQPQECGDLETSGAKAGQYKIPISSASTTTPVYLGEVESTRRIKKLALTGQENFDHYGSGVFWVKVEDNNAMINRYGVSNSYVFNPIILDIPTTIANNEFCLTSANGRLWIRNTNYNNADGFKSYLAAQYAAGTPVTVWYVLATEETGTVNEPIRKIGDYADTVSGISIPTITGKDTVDVQTTLKPSEVELTYTGWHDANVKEWDGSEWT